MEKGGGDPATAAAGGMCDRFLTFLARNLTMSRVKSIADGPRNGAGAGAGHPPPEGGEEDDHEEQDDFAIPIERADFDDYEFGSHGDEGYSTATTVLEESAAATATKTGSAAADAPVAGAGPAPSPEVAAVEEKETKVRKTVTIKEQEGGAPPLERKRSSLFKKRRAPEEAAASEQQQGGAAARVPRRAGLRPRMPAVLRVPTNINERSSTFIEERRKSFGGRGRGNPPAPDK
ncbi:unnamed protein product [Urochloa decumbens]|uniref:Uncharacterized protein n=1 Tax=Urochloa decumbens TaxID=240449 RepID=A0ABC9AYN8_9POAL